MKIKLFAAGIIILSSVLCFNFSLALGREQGINLQEQNKAGPGVSSASDANKISLDIKGMDIVDVLKMLATRSGINIVIGKNVTGRVTLFLKNVDIKDAFDIIILANDLAYEKNQDIVNVMTQKDYELLYGTRFQDKKQAKTIRLKFAKAVDLSRALNQIKSNIGRIVVDEGSNAMVLIDAPEKIQDMETFIKAADLPIQTKIFNLGYGQADKIQPKLQEAITKGVGSIKIDERTNKIAVTDYVSKLKEIEKLIRAFDEKSPQVLIDAQIIEIRPSDKFEMGVDWDYWIRKHFEISTSLPITTTGKLSFGTTNTTPAKTGQYKAIVQLLRTIGDTKILSSPRIIALNNQEAKILVGTKDAYITSTISQGGTGTAVTAQSVNFVDVGIKLFVTPTINRDGFVTMKIRPEVSSSTRTNITSEGQITQIPIVSTSEAETTVMVKDGVTIIIGGLKKDQKTKTEFRIPILGDIPFLGVLFRNTSDERSKTELVILLTPHIITGESPYTEFSQIKPVDGAVAKMVEGEIFTDNISLASAIQEDAMTSLVSLDSSIDGYYQTISKKIIQFAKLNPPEGKKGKVNLKFSVYSDGSLVEEPQVLDSSDSSLAPFSVKAIKDASPFPIFPKDLKKAVATFKISLFYE